MVKQQLFTQAIIVRDPIISIYNAPLTVSLSLQLKKSCVNFSFFRFIFWGGRSFNFFFFTVRINNTLFIHNPLSITTYKDAITQRNRKLSLLGMVS